MGGMDGQTGPKGNVPGAISSPQSSRTRSPRLGHGSGPCRVHKVSPDLQGSREIQVLRVFLVLKARLVHQGKRVHWENPAFLACLEQMVLRATLAKKVPLGRRGVRVHLAPRAQSDTLALVVSRNIKKPTSGFTLALRRSNSQRGSLPSGRASLGQSPGRQGLYPESGVRMLDEPKGTFGLLGVKMASRDSKATWALKETGVKLAPLVHGVRMDLKAQKAAGAPMEIQDHLALPEKRGNLEFLDCQVILVDKVPRGPSDFQGSQAPMERKVEGAPLANRGQEANAAQRVHEEKEVSGASQASLGQRATLVGMVHRALQAKGVLQGLRDLRDFLDQKVLRVPPEKTGCLATLGREGKL
ncbi:UNVERIFIED_CONTAM: hypothetical protein K2H54_048403 [Gekko kuhli]